MKRNHHTTPRHYLKGFADPHDHAFIWEYQRGKPFGPGHRADRHHPVKRALKKAGVISEYYGPIEDDLARTEQQVVPVIDRLRLVSRDNATPLVSAAEKQMLANHVVHLYRRTTNRDERMPAMWDRVNKNFPWDEWQYALALRGDFTNARKIVTLKEEFARGIPDEIRQASLLLKQPNVQRRINEMPWSFYNTDAAFLTCDNPVRIPEYEGLGHPLAFAYLPLSTAISLFVGSDEVRKLFNLPTTADTASTIVNIEQTATLNHLSITGAQKYVYFHVPAEWIVTSFA